MDLLFVHSEIDDAGLSVSAFRVLAHLSRRANKSSGLAWPGIDSMAATCRLNRKTVIGAVRELEGTGWVVAERQSGIRTLYRLTVPQNGPVRNEHRSEIGNATVPQNGLEPVQNEERKGIHEGYLKRGSNGSGRGPKFFAPKFKQICKQHPNIAAAWEDYREECKLTQREFNIRRKIVVEAVEAGMPIDEVYNLIVSDMGDYGGGVLVKRILNFLGRDAGDFERVPVA